MNLKDLEFICLKETNETESKHCKLECIWQILNLASGAL